MVDKHHWIFLTEKEAKAAIAIDFQQYGFQPPLFYEISPLILGIQARVIPEGKNAGVWISSCSNNRMKKIADEQLGGILLSTLTSKPYPLSVLSEICALVFQVRAYPGNKCDESKAGIWIESDMNRFVCRQCGDCCRGLDYTNECTEEDHDRWLKFSRYDILDRVMVIERKDNQKEYKIWTEPDTQTFLKICPWLEKVPNENKYRCLIQDVKPEICRDYPFTHKHAIMTGCNGEFRNTIDEISC